VKKITSGNARLECEINVFFSERHQSGNVAGCRRAVPLKATALVTAFCFLKDSDTGRGGAEDEREIDGERGWQS